MVCVRTLEDGRFRLINTGYINITEMIYAGRGIVIT